MDLLLLLSLLPLQWFYLCTSVISPTRLTGNEPLSILPLNSLPEENVGRAHFKLCDRLKLEKKQRRMCRRDPGVAETLREAVTMSALECQYQFRFERWNCTLEGRHRANILKRGMVLSSIGSSGGNLPRLFHAFNILYLKWQPNPILFYLNMCYWLIHAVCWGPHRLVPDSTWASFMTVGSDQVKVGLGGTVDECDSGSTVSLHLRVLLDFTATFHQ